MRKLEINPRIIKISRLLIPIIIYIVIFLIVLAIIGMALYVHGHSLAHSPQGTVISITPYYIFTLILVSIREIFVAIRL